MTNWDFLEKMFLLNWQTSYVRFMTQFKSEQKMICLILSEIGPRWLTRGGVTSPVCCGSSSWWHHPVNTTFIHLFTSTHVNNYNYTVCVCVCACVFWRININDQTLVMKCFLSEILNQIWVQGIFCLQMRPFTKNINIHLHFLQSLATEH